MSDVVDSCVVAKWLLPEADDAKTMRLLGQAITAGERLFEVHPV